MGTIGLSLSISDDFRQLDIHKAGHSIKLQSRRLAYLLVRLVFQALTEAPAVGFSAEDLRGFPVVGRPLTIKKIDRHIREDRRRKRTEPFRLFRIIANRVQLDVDVDHEGTAVAKLKDWLEKAEDEAKAGDEVNEASQSLRRLISDGNSKTRAVDLFSVANALFVQGKPLPEAIRVIKSAINARLDLVDHCQALILLVWAYTYIDMRQAWEYLRSLEGIVSPVAGQHNEEPTFQMLALECAELRARCHYFQNQREAALRIYEELMPRLKLEGSAYHTLRAKALLGYARALLAFSGQGAPTNEQVEEAIDNAAEARAAYRRANRLSGERSSLALIGRCHLYRAVWAGSPDAKVDEVDELERAERELSLAVDLRKASGWPGRNAEAEIYLSWVIREKELALEGRLSVEGYRRARQHLREALRIVKASGAVRNQATAWTEWAFLDLTARQHLDPQEAVARSFDPVGKFQIASGRYRDCGCEFQAKVQLWRAREVRRLDAKARSRSRDPGRIDYSTIDYGIGMRHVPQRLPEINEVGMNMSNPWT